MSRETAEEAEKSNRKLGDAAVLIIDANRYFTVRQRH
jgi:hypothetical protein